MLLEQETKPLWVTSRHALKLLGVSASTLYRKRKAGEIKFKPMREGSHIILYWYEDLER
jgi:hypothetical protein